MQCSTCGAELPPTAAFCPDCGTPATYALPSSETPPSSLPAYDPSLQPAPPSTDYGSPPYGLSQPDYSAYNPYEIANPYEVTPLPPPSLPPPPRRKGKSGLIAGLVLLALILAGASVFAFSSQIASHKAITVSTPSATTVQSTPTTVPSSTAGSTPYGSYSGTLVINDPLLDNSRGYNWQQVSDSNGSCAFTAGGYQVKSQNGGYFYPCTAQSIDYANFVFEVQLKIVKGDCGGVLFRENSAANDFYFLDVCQDGSTALFMYVNNNGSTLIASHASSAIHTGYNQTNLIAIAVQGSTLTIYINHQQTDSTSDSSYSHGQIALVVDGYPHNSPTEAVFSNVKLWQI